MDTRARLAKSLKAKGISQAELARRIGIKPQQIPMLFHNKTGHTKHWPAIAEALGVPVEWLTTGQGQPPAWATPQDVVDAGMGGPTRDQLLVALDGRTKELLEMAASKVRTVTVSSANDQGFPIAGEVTAGDGWAKGEEDRPIMLRSGLAAVRVRGDSAEPVILDGQWVLADPSRTGDRLAADAIVVVQTQDGGAYCKRLCGEQGGLLFLASLREGRRSVIAPSEGAIVWQVVGVIFPEAVRGRQ